MTGHLQSLSSVVHPTGSRLCTKANGTRGGLSLRLIDDLHRSFFYGEGFQVGWFIFYLR